eukprot:235150-Pyramimonas_sp.AAC.1
MATNGTYADSRCARATSLATKTRVVIWAKAGDKWTLYGPPAEDLKQLRGPWVWLALSDQRYQRP